MRVSPLQLRLRHVTAWLAVLVTTAPVIHGAQVYVDAVHGNDGTGDGSFATPLQSLPAAQVAVRRQLQAQVASGVLAPIDVILRGGTYTLASTLEFGVQDSGLSSAAVVTYKPYCNPLAPSDLSILPFPYVMGSATPLRYLWNGVNAPSTWTGPIDPLLQVGVNVSSGTIPPTVLWNGTTPTCVDKVGVGHTCYTAMAPCVHDCMTACENDVDKRVYPDSVYAEFYLLFGRDLKKEEACVETCSVSCTTCEKVTLSGMTTIPNAAWTAFTPANAWHLPQAQIYSLDLTAYAPSAAGLIELYVNGVRQPRASFPNVLVSPNNGNIATTTTPTWQSQYISVAATASVGRVLAFSPAAMSSKATNWTRLATAQVEVLSSTTLANTWHGIYAMNQTTIDLDAGGGQINGTIFHQGPDWPHVQGFRVENVFEELDAPGEWYFDSATSTLYVIPPAGVVLSQSTISFPHLKQLVRIRGTPGIDVGFAQPGVGTVVTAVDTETADPAPQQLWATNLAFDGLVFTGTVRTDMELCTHAGVNWLSMTQTTLRPLGRHFDLVPELQPCTWKARRPSASAIARFRMYVVFDDVIVWSDSRVVRPQMGGNAIVLSGRTTQITIALNHIHHIGSSGVAVVAKSVTPHASSHPRQFLHTTNSTISYNQIHDYGLVTRQSAALLVVGTSQTIVYGNLVYAVPPGGVSYSQSNANAGMPPLDSSEPMLVDGDLPGILVRPLAAPLTPPTISAAPLLGGLYTTSINLGRLDNVIFPLQAKIIGGPVCAAAAGRIGTLYGTPTAGCSGCCPTTQDTAGIRNLALGIPAFTTLVAVQPGNVLDLQVKSALHFGTPVDVYVGFHLVTPNRLVELPTWRFHWQVVTRLCTLLQTQQTVSCGGPCGCAVSAGVSNMPACPLGFDAQPTSLACAGPFQAWSTCQTGAMARVLYFNCTELCFQSTCT
ncbi:Aste57867_22393 [Aphanomyces stellatus]|uniref:Aste57867_22393 protein n=1 Tax=Aphanomyces stellatus TaxID=120398 RepID=A0A485LK87_9STRA|nr:hypothetical protein As57867_022323 [Aphanomyces stellatus]VFT99056.1 Aste57867_22393 [Aphanomyces stellatus]